MADITRRLADAELRRFESGATTLLIVNLREQAAAEASVREVEATRDLWRAAAAWRALTACDVASGGERGTRVIVLGVDGMDYALARRLIDEGELPNFARLEQMGQFSPLETSAPPLSPVA